MPALWKDLSKITDYATHLEECWQEHLAPRGDNTPTVISTFAGAGGSSLGYSMAGFRELLAVEWDNNAVETFKVNFPDVPVYHGDIAQLSVEQVLSQTGLKPGELDVFDGSPPCQGFSTAGRRALDDPRNQLFREYVRLLRGLQPKVFVMENVSGMVKGKMKVVFWEILQELRASGYKVSARVLNTMYFGVPQARERVIIIGVREDLKIGPSHPKAMVAPISISESWYGVAAPEPECNIERYAIGAEWHNVKQGGKSAKYLSLVKPRMDKPSPTITKGAGSISLASVVHPLECRKYSSGEAKRIGSFPDSFVMVGGWSATLARIGNSVPPLFMRAIAKHIRHEVLDKLETSWAKAIEEHKHSDVMTMSA